MPSAQPVPMIRGEKVWLRPLEQRDLEPYHLACTDHDIAHLAGFPHPLSETNVSTWFERARAQHGDQAYYFTICRLGSDAFIGTVWLMRIDLVHGCTEVAILIAKEEWGKGYGTDALNAVVDFGFGELPLERIWLTVDSGNERAKASYRRAGFTEEGTLRRSRRHRGTFVDRALMSMLREEWWALTRRRSWQLHEAASPSR
jgi:[ribosomal protein S5]-alanine N-acetyltransferase